MPNNMSEYGIPLNKIYSLLEVWKYRWQWIHFINESVESIQKGMQGQVETGGAYKKRNVDTHQTYNTIMDFVRF